MAYYENEYKRRLLGDPANNSLITLIAVHLVVFVLFFFAVTLMRLGYQSAAETEAAFSQNVLSWMVLPASLSKLLSRPWTLLTYGFTETSGWRILANMLWLWSFGRILQDLTGNRKLFPAFFYGVIAGGVVFVLALNILPSLKDQVPVAFTLGASTGVMSVAVTTMMVSPGYRIFPMLNGGIPLWVVTAVFILIDLAGVPGRHPALYAAHLAAGFTGFLYMYAYKRGYDWGEWINNFFDWVTNLFNPDKPKKGKSVREELFYRASTQPFTKTPNVTEQRIDEILEKIHAKGFHTLTEEEKDLLKRASQKDA